MNQRKISLLMVLVMLFSFCPSVSENKAAKALTNKSRVSLAEEKNDETNSQLLYGNSGDSSIFSGKTFKITYHITGKWENAYNASITIENLSDEVIHDWALLFYLDDNVINNIWNAKVANKDNGLYLLDNNDWNMDILAKQSVSFGFTAEYGKGAILPRSYALTTCQGDVLEADYTVHYRVESNGGGELAATMEIENMSDSIIEDWSLTFDYENEIHNLWCGDLQTKEKKDSQYHYLVNNPGWSQNIEPEQRVTFGFLADSSTLDAVPKNYSMKKYSNEINYDRDSDGDELTDVDEVILGTNPYDSDDRMGLMTFSVSANYVQKFTSSSKKLYNKIDSIACKGATDKEVGLKESVDCFTKNYQSTGNKKNIILLCDGAINYKVDVIQKAKQNQIAIHVILIGENQAREEKCKKIANETGGSYYLIKKESEIEGTVAKLGKQLLGTIDTTDTDQDGIYDVFEKHGVLAANGQLIKSDYQKKDTDGDGLSDFYEWMGTNDTSKKLTKKTVTIKAGEKEVGVYSTSYYSNPANKDTDRDGYNDKVDKTPKKNSITEYNLKSPGYVQVYRDGVRTYGGNQRWFNDKKLDMCNNYLIEDHGCGLIACTDVTLYLRLGKKVKGKEDKDISQLNDGGLLIQSDAYMDFVRDVMKDKLKLHNYGMSDGQVKQYFNNYFKKYDIKLKAKHAQVDDLLGYARKSLKKNMPLITASGKQPKDVLDIILYKKIGRGDKNFSNSIDKNSKLQFIDSGQDMNNHYVAVTGLLFDEQIGKRMVKVSSWAEAYYIDYDVFYDYVQEQKTSKIWQSGVVYFK